MVDGSRQMIATWPAPPGPHHRQMTIVPPPGAGTASGAWHPGSAVAAADWAATVPRPLIVDSATAILQVILLIILYLILKNEFTKIFYFRIKGK